MNGKKDIKPKNNREDSADGRKTFRSADPIGRGTIETGYIKALKDVGASPELIHWAESRAQKA